jgi:hypothetical protein
MGERADASSVGSGRMDSPLSAIHHHHLSNNQPQHYLDIGNHCIITRITQIIHHTHFYNPPIHPDVLS